MARIPACRIYRLSAHLQIDLSNLGEAHGRVALGVDGVVSNQTLHYFGASGTPTSNFLGSIPIVNGDYVVSLPAGTYYMCVETILSSPTGYADSSVMPVTVHAGDTACHRAGR